MYYRVTDSSTQSRLTDQIGTARNRVALYQERVSSGKKINRPSDDPGGAGAVLRLRTTTATIERFQKNTSAATTELSYADGALDGYGTALDRARTLATAGLSPTLNAVARGALATEIDGLRQQMLTIANTQDEDGYVFGGTRQDAPPFDPATGAPAATPTSARTLQLEPNATPVQLGVTADTVFGDATGTVFDQLTSLSAALRGTGDPVADQATIQSSISRLATLTTVANAAQTVVGTSFEATTNASARLGSASQTTARQLNDTETADFAESAVGLVQSQQALDALVQTAGTTNNRKSLIDFLG